MIYLIGNITDNKDFANQFMEQHVRLYKLGYDILNPVDLAIEYERKHKGTIKDFPSMPDIEYFKNSIKHLLDSDVTGYYLVNEATSFGCLAEINICKKLGIERIE